MAWTVNVSVTDDLDGGAADETVRFCLDGTSYAIDLSTGNALELRGVLGRYVLRARAQAAAGPAIGGPLDTSGLATSGLVTSGPGGGPGSQTAVIRAWARQNGFAVSRVGRLPATIQRAYQRANADGHHPPGVPSGPTSPGSFPTPPEATDTTTMEHR